MCAEAEGFYRERGVAGRGALTEHHSLAPERHGRGGFLLVGVTSCREQPEVARDRIDAVALIEGGEDGRRLELDRPFRCLGDHVEAETPGAHRGPEQLPPLARRWNELA